MPRFALIDTAIIPDNGGELRLFQRGDEYSIRMSGLQGELMNSRTHGSEDALGQLSCKPLGGVSAARVLVGGLGMGFTLAAALKCLAADAEVTVAELVPGVLQWNQTILGACAGYPLQDSRVRIETADVARLIASSAARFDAILLDVDNGPEGLTHSSNDQLYSRAGLVAAAHALRPKGTLAIWSALPSPTFTALLKSVGFKVTQQTVRAHAGKGARHVIWLASLPS